MLVSRLQVHKIHIIKLTANKQKHATIRRHKSYITGYMLHCMYYVQRSDAETSHSLKTNKLFG